MSPERPTLSLEQHFQLVSVGVVIDNCQDVKALQDMLKEVTRSNLLQKAYYEEMLKKHWGM